MDNTPFLLREFTLPAVVVLALLVISALALLLVRARRTARAPNPVAQSLAAAEPLMAEPGGVAEPSPAPQPNERAVGATPGPPPIRHDVFISYSSKDKPQADAICAVMEREGVRCWMAPRDILPGQDWAGSVLRAIAGAKVVVLVFSSASNASPQVRREIERAVHNEVAIIPVRIEDATPSESLEYFISTPHWLDAITPPLEAHAVRLAQSVKALLAQPAQ